MAVPLVVYACKAEPEPSKVTILSRAQGTPDNIRRVAGSATYYVALGSKRALPFSLPQAIAPFRLVRKLLGVLSLEVMVGLIPKACLVVEMDEAGRVVKTLSAPTTSCFWVSEVEEHSGFLYLGSWRAPVFARAKQGLPL